MKLMILAMALGASTGCRAPERSRYEIETVQASSPVIHLCDTWTGQVWYYSRQNRWEPLTALEKPED